MFCPSDVSTGLVQIVGPIQQTDLNSITVADVPISISFGSSIPSMDGNHIHVDSSTTQTTCRYKGKLFTLMDIQICSSVHKGYRLPGMTDEPIAEMILSFSPPSTPSDRAEYSGILMCFPIYGSGPNHHDSYLMYAISPQATSSPPSLSTLFYENPSDSSQTSLAYKTCFETIASNGTADSKSLYVIVFPHGICNTSLASLSSSLPSYKVPIPIRGTGATVLRYHFDDDGNKTSTANSEEGILYTTQLSSCSDEFKKRIEHFTIPPGLPSSLKFSSKAASNPLYKPAQYKCVPFDQLRDMSGEYVKLGSKTMEQIMSEQKKATCASQDETASSSSKNSESTDLALEIIGTGIGIVVISTIAYQVWKLNNE